MREGSRLACPHREGSFGVVCGMCLWVTWPRPRRNRLKCGRGGRYMRHLAGFKEVPDACLPYNCFLLCLPVSRAVGGLLVTLVREYRPPVAALFRASLRRRRLRLRLRGLGLGSGCSARAGMGRGRGRLHFGAMSTSCGKKKQTVQHHVYHAWSHHMYLLPFFHNLERRTSAWLVRTRSMAHTNGCTFMSWHVYVRDGEGEIIKSRAEYTCRSTDKKPHK